MWVQKHTQQEPTHNYWSCFTLFLLLKVRPRVFSTIISTSVFKNFKETVALVVLLFNAMAVTYMCFMAFSHQY